MTYKEDALRIALIADRHGNLSPLLRLLGRMVFGLSLWGKPSYSLDKKRESEKGRRHQEDATRASVK